MRLEQPGSSWAEARVKIARVTLTIKLDGNWSSFQLANSAPPLSVTDSAIAPSARINRHGPSTFVACALNRRSIFGTTAPQKAAS